MLIKIKMTRCKRKWRGNVSFRNDEDCRVCLGLF